MVMNGMLIVEEVVSHARVCISTFIFYGCSSQLHMQISMHMSIQFLSVVAPIEIKLQGMEHADISWNVLGTGCMDNLQPTANKLEKKTCLLSIGQTYKLQCTSAGGSWWKSNYLVIENSVYCEYAKGSELINITITGKFLSLFYIYS